MSRNDGRGPHHPLSWGRCDVGEICFVFFLVPRYEVLCFQNLLVYLYIACCLIAPGGRCLGCDLTAFFFCCLVHHSLIFQYDDYFCRVETGNHGDLVRHFEACRAYSASLGTGNGVAAESLDQVQKHIARRHTPGGFRTTQFAALFSMLLQAIRFFLAHIVRCGPISK